MPSWLSSRQVPSSAMNRSDVTTPAAALVVDRPLRRDAAQNRERLLTAASQVFAERGLDAGVEEVARAAGVGMGTLYRRFPSKQALIDELVGLMLQDFLDIARTASARTDGTGLENLLVHTGQLQAAHPGCLRRLWAQSDAGREAIEHFRGHIPILLRSAQEHGRIRPDVTTSDILMMLWSISAIIDTTTAAAPNAWRRHVELVIAGLRPVTPDHLAAELTERPLTMAQALKVTAPSR
ncbi:MAG: HTH-type transcriptional regulator [Pseudonocardiales bacterium]|nr:HTH-type transcriptional regulator [Pseudonocardiales bacterium]